MDVKAPVAQSSFDRLMSALTVGTASVGVCGMGYVGLPLAMAAWDAGFTILAFDNDPEKEAG